MCGIVVGLAFGKLSQRDEAMRQRLLRYFTTELLLATEDRGKDATGATVLFNDGNYMGVKRGDKVSNFLATFGESKSCYGSLLKVWREHPKRGRVYLGHCRAGTTGDKEDNENNHPIKIGNLIGIHNGVIKNHDTIFAKLGCGRDGKVDSESIFRLFEYYTDKGKEPFTMDMLQSVVDRLDGQFAVTLFNADNLEQIPIFRDGRPVEFVLIRKYGILLMVSEIKFWNRIHFRYERMANYYSEFNSVNLPSFLDDDEIVTAAMPDDTAIIFDLSKKVTKDTKISELGKSQKMIRTNKIWQARTVSTYYNRSGYNSDWNKKHKSITIEHKADPDKKRRVFDNITKQYKVTVGDKEIDDKKSTTLIVEGKDTETDDSTNQGLTGDKSTKPETKSVAEDVVDENATSKVSIDDRTTYTKDEDDDIIELDPKDVIVTTEIPDRKANVIDVNMATYSPEIVEATNKAYDKLAPKDRGCANLDELLDVLEIASKDKADALGMALIGNRAIRHGWMRGYMHAMNSLSDAGKDKDKQRERHIAGLKSLVMILAAFYDKSKGDKPEASGVSTIIKRRLAESAISLNRKVDVEAMSKIFNSHEKGVLEEISNIVSKAESIASDD